MAMSLPPPPLPLPPSLPPSLYFMGFMLTLTIPMTHDNITEGLMFGRTGSSSGR